MKRWKEETIHVLNTDISVFKQDAKAICMHQKDSACLNVGFFFTIVSRENKQKWDKISLATPIPIFSMKFSYDLNILNYYHYLQQTNNSID